MVGTAKPIPEGFHTVTPYLVVEGAEKTIEFLQHAFGAELQGEAMKRPDGKVMHATMKIGDSMVMLADACEQAKAAPAMLYLYMPNVDAAYQLALKAGGTSIMEPTGQFYGDRSGGVKDPAGNQWFVATHVEDVTPDEIKRRAAEAAKQQSKAA